MMEIDNEFTPEEIAYQKSKTVAIGIAAPKGRPNDELTVKPTVSDLEKFVEYVNDPTRKKPVINITHEDVAADGTTIDPCGEIIAFNGK